MEESLSGSTGSVGHTEFWGTVGTLILLIMIPTLLDPLPAAPKLIKVCQYRGCSSLLGGEEREERRKEAPRRAWSEEPQA